MVYHYEPKFYCNQCDYKSHTKSDLNKHIKTHSKDTDWFSNVNFFKFQQSILQNLKFYMND